MDQLATETEKCGGDDSSITFSPGPVGLQLEDGGRLGSRVVRFIDGGPHHPGPARASGRIQPGDWITTVQVHDQIATQYTEMLQLLQQNHSTRKLTVLSFANYMMGVSAGEVGTSTDAMTPETVKAEKKVKVNDDCCAGGLDNTMDSTMTSDAKQGVFTKNDPNLELVDDASEKDAKESNGAANRQPVHLQVLHCKEVSTRPDWHTLLIIPPRNRVVQRAIRLGTVFGTTLEDIRVIKSEPWVIQVAISASGTNATSNSCRLPKMGFDGEQCSSWRRRAINCLKLLPCERKVADFDGRITIPKTLTFSKPRVGKMTVWSGSRAGKRFWEPEERGPVLLCLGTRSNKSFSVQPLEPVTNSTFSVEEINDDIKHQPQHLVSSTPKAEENIRPNLSKPNESTLLHKAKAKHQLTLARLRVQRQFDKRMNRDNGQTTEEWTQPTLPKTEEAHTVTNEVLQRAVEKDSLKTITSSAPVIPSVIDFSQFSQEQSIFFEPGPVGMQLEPVTHEETGLNRDYAAKIVRFVDGGPQNPGSARASGRLRPGDFVIRVEAEGIVGTTYYTALHLLQKSWTTRKLTFRSAWDPSTMGSSSNPPFSLLNATHIYSSHADSTLRITSGKPSPGSAVVDTTSPGGTPQHLARRHSPLNDSSPLPYDWTPLPYDWVYKRPLPPPEERPRIYRSEVERLVQEAEARKEKERLDQIGHTWDFANVMIGAVAVTAESVAGCLRKERHDSDDDDDVYYEQTEEYHEKKE
jgi:hypothetical protein